MGIQATQNPTFIRPWETPCETVDSLEAVSKFKGKVLKYTCDWGKSWNYFYVDSPVYSKKGELIGVSAHSEQRLWNDRLVGTKVLFTQDSFVKGPFEGKRAFFETASYQEFSERLFSGFDSSLPDSAASHQASAHPIDIPLARAPLTMVRCTEETEVKISVLFNEKMSPRAPLVPPPNIAMKKDNILKFSWDVAAQPDGKMRWLGQEFQMIWWEAMRQGPFASVDEKKAVCVKRDEVKSYLEGYLAKKGVSESERAAFVVYWEKQILSGYDAPYVLIQPVQDVLKYVPDMKVTSETKFDLKRFYFLFKPVEDNAKGLPFKKAIDSLAQEKIAANAVIDLGGEFAEGLKQKEWDEETFQREFVQKYISG